MGDTDLDPTQVKFTQQGPGQPPVPPNMNATAGGGWMPPPGTSEVAASNVPPGLEYLTYLDQLLVQQVVELLEAFTGWETDNKYAVKNMMGQQCYYALEESGCCSKMCCKDARGFTMKIVDNTQREVIRARRDFNCCATKCCWLPCCGCCRHEIVVESPPGVVIGRVHNECSFIRQSFSVKLGDEGSEEEVLKIVGPLCLKRSLCCICCDVTFTIESTSTGDEVGKLKKQFTGMVKEVFTDADNFSVTFPKDLDVRAKAVLLCAVFLIDFLYYENKPSDNKDIPTPS